MCVGFSFLLLKTLQTWPVGVEAGHGSKLAGGVGRRIKTSENNIPSETG